MNDFDKTFVLAFYNSFFKMKLNCYKNKYVDFEYMRFQNKMF